MHRHETKKSLTLCLLPALVLSCTPLGERPTDSPPPDQLVAARLQIGPDWPADANRRRTTGGDIYVSNLESQIDALEARLALMESASLRARLALLYYHRFQVLGHLEDAEYARHLLCSGSDKVRHPDIALARARVLIGFHEFSSARSALDSAVELGADAAQLAEARRAIVRATGVQDESLAAVGRADDPVALVHSAVQALDYGRAVDATRLLRQAQEAYTDSSPYVLAWIHVQQGIIFLRYGDYASARVFFEAAHQRLPGYALAAEHLAETEFALGRLEAARRLYTEVARQTAHPEFFHQLSRVETQLGLDEPAARHAKRAEVGYQRLLAKQPLMYADHAAGYYMDVGREDEAYRLARANAELRRDVSSRLLLTEAQLQTGHRVAACAGFEQLRRQGYAPPELAALAERCEG